jgi:16S rRNA (adenine1518-N6/adenine1519-N6)-dimethyltransferase
MISNPIATKKRTREIQEKWNAQTKKSFGQNFIVEPGVVDKIAKEAAGKDPAENMVMFEIGPGIGALTQYLCQYAPQVIAYEIDPRFPEVLQTEIGADNLEVRLQDFLEVDLDSLLEPYDKAGIPVRFASNLPYYITTPILFKLFECEKNIDAVTVMMQKEVADRFAAAPNSKEYNALSVITQYRTNIRKVMDVNRNVFWPSPNVGSSVLQFTFKKERPIKNEKLFIEMVKAAFTQRRKTLHNNLAAWIDDKEKAKEWIEKAGFAPSVRAQQLSLEDYIRLFEVYDENYCAG